MCGCRLNCQEAAVCEVAGAEAINKPAPQNGTGLCFDFGKQAFSPAPPPLSAVETCMQPFCLKRDAHRDLALRRQGFLILLMDDGLRRGSRSRLSLLLLNDRIDPSHPPAHASWLHGRMMPGNRPDGPSPSIIIGR